jgi:hypothetical protein
VSADLNGLSANTTYHFRITASNSAGNSNGADATFTASGANWALAANGGVVSASSTFSSAYPTSAANNGDRSGINWAAGGGWNDATAGSYPDWLQVDFNGSKSISEIDVFTLQDNYPSPAVPTQSMTFTQHGITDFQVQYWNGTSWVTVTGGGVTGNNLVWRRFTFSPVVTNRIRVNITGSLNLYSRIVEIEAWQ